MSKFFTLGQNNQLVCLMRHVAHSLRAHRITVGKARAR